MEALKKYAKQSEGVDPAALLFSTIRWSATQFHIWHFETKNEAFHTLAQEYYEKIIDKMDSFVEVYMGHYGMFTAPSQIPNQFVPFEEYVENENNVIYRHLMQMFSVIDKIRNHPRIAAKQSLIHQINKLDSFLNSIKYKLTLK